MKNKKLIIMMAFYVLFMGVLFLSSNVLTRYFTNSEINGNFDIGKKLYFEYERGDLFRNDQLIVGVKVEDPKYDEEGNVVSYSRRIETKNVIPGDALVYHFYLSNYNPDTNEANGIDGVFHTYGTAQLSMPEAGMIFDLKCEIQYRKVDEFGNSVVGDAGNFKSFTSDSDENLPVYDKVNHTSTYSRYEFTIKVQLADQIDSTDSNDYFGAVLSIYLSVIAANKIV